MRGPATLAATATALAVEAKRAETPGPTSTFSLTPAIALPDATSTPTESSTEYPTPISFDRDPRAVLIEADIAGSTESVPRDMHVPTFRLFADGFVVCAGATTPISTGFDAEVRVGRLSELEIQELLRFLDETAFFSLGSYYEPRPAPPNLPTARISVYLETTKTVTVYGPGFPGTPQSFFEAFNRITQTRPSDDAAFTPRDAYLVATPAGSVNEAKTLGEIAEWPRDIGQSLAGATDGVSVSGTAFQGAAAAISRSSRMLFREGSQVYRVRFATNAPRSVHLSDWVGTILQGVREFEGRYFELVGYFRGANLLGEARGIPPSPNAWVILDNSGAMYVTGAAPPLLDPNSRADIWTIVRIRAVVVYVRGGTSYLEARSITLQ